MEEVLLTAPMLASTAGLSRGELHRRWNDWKKQVKCRLEAGDYMPFLELQLLAKVKDDGEGWVVGNDAIVSCRSCVGKRVPSQNQSELVLCYVASRMLLCFLSVLLCC